ncbi:lipase family protein [Zhongshania borealis]|uniref:Fungal lipase-type domain-containing protein n=1 Tax=Zhongshania borealis TaxID=889488 RepID=A0ABP7WFC6_9GAMM
MSVNNSCNHQAVAELCELSYTRTTFSISEVDVLMVDVGHAIHLAVRGTEIADLKPASWSLRAVIGAALNLRDIFRDLRFYRMKTRRGRVHRGFYLSALRWVTTYNRVLPNKPIYLSGHSKGAAEASHIAQMLAERGRTISQLVMFGEPASRSKTSRDYFQTLRIPTVSYINPRDWIKFTPPWDHPTVPRTQLSGARGHSITTYIHNLENKAHV